MIGGQLAQSKPILHGVSHAWKTFEFGQAALSTSPQGAGYFARSQGRWTLWATRPPTSRRLDSQDSRFCKWTGVKALVAAQSHWSAVAADINCFETRLALAAWGLELRVGWCA
jgi:hypothetical protein